jgi:hypothetical protein
MTITRPRNTESENLPRVRKKIIEPLIKYRTSENLDVCLIEFESDCLRIDFIGKPDLSFDFDWWINISKVSFIRPSGTGLKLGMLKASGIPLSPDRYYFPNQNSTLHFSLFFPLPPAGTRFIDVIENEMGGADFYNFYHVALSRIADQPLFVGGITIELN